MAAVIINATKAIVFLVVGASAIVSMYAAINATSIYTNIDVFFSGLLVIAIGVLLGPLFCFIAGYGMIYFLDLPAGEAAVIVLPAFLAWCFIAVRTLAGVAGM